MEINTEIAEKLTKATEVSAESKTPDIDVTVKRVPKIDNLGRAYGTGGRKSASARVWIEPGTGKIQVNKKDVSDYFKRPVLKMVVTQPLKTVDMLGRFDIYATVKGSGLSGQAGAVRHGISRALDNYNPDYHKLLHDAKFLTRDPRKVERKKYGRKKARKSFQFSKR